jgi:hypothetical protein
VAVRPEGIARTLQVRRVVMAISLRQHLDRHTKITGCFPWIDTSLHQPSCSSVPKDMRGYITTEPSVLHCARERFLDPYNRLPVPFHSKTLSAGPPAPQMSEQLGGNGTGGWRFFVSLKPAGRR